MSHSEIERIAKRVVSDIVPGYGNPGDVEIVVAALSEMRGIALKEAAEIADEFSYEAAAAILGRIGSL